MKSRLTSRLLGFLCKATVLALPGLFASTGRAAPEGAKDPTRDLAAYWTFDEGVGTTAYDYSGHGNKGILHGGAKWTAGKFGKALYFNGADSSVEVPDGEWNKSAPITFTFWFKSDGGRGQIIEHQMGGAIRGAYAFDGNRFGMYDGAVTDTGAKIGGAGDDWTFVAITLSDGEVKAYKNGELQETNAIKGFPKVSAPFFIGARGSVGDQFFKGWIDDVAIYHAVLTPEEIQALSASYAKGLPPAPHEGLQVVDVYLPKLYYPRGSSAVAKVIVKNFSNKLAAGTLFTKTVTALANERSLASQPIQVEPLGVVMRDVPVTFENEDYGCQIRANVKYDLTAAQPKWGEGVTTEFSVADNFWKVAIGGSLPSGQAANETPAELGKRLSQIRASYGNWVELFFWAPDDWGLLAPGKDRPWWYSGQEGYFVRRDSVKSLIDQAHAYGMKAITYGKCTAGGPDGWEIARRHPDWFITDNFERPGGIGYPYDLDNWNNRELRQSGGFKPGSTWQFINPDMRRQAPVDWGIEQIALSAKAFGWDGVRFDGHYTVSNDELSTHNMRRLKEVLWKQDPSFLFGFNYAYSPELYNGINHEMREGMAGGGMWMQEAINNWAYTNAKRYKEWSFYAANELKVAKQIQAVGGTYHCIYSLAGDVKNQYKLMYGLIAGGHPVYSTHYLVPGCANWGKFMTRWSQFLWSQNLKVMTAPQKRIEVKAPAPVHWQPLAQEMVASPTRKFWVVHLVNPPRTESIEKTDNSQLSEPQQNITVALNPPAGERIIRVALVRPEATPYDTALVPVALGDSQTVTVPELRQWAMLLVELDGKYTVPAALPRFSPPADAAQVAAAQKAALSPGTAPAVIDPLHPSIGIEAGPNEKIWETDSGFWNIAADTATDPDASSGIAQKRQGGGGYLGRTWLGPFPPGRYKFSLRMKWSGPNAAKLGAYVRVTTADSKTNYVTHALSLNDEAATGHKPNVYQYHVLDVDIKEGDLAQCYVGVAGMESPDDAVYLDLLKTEQVESYSDRQLAAWAKTVTRPATLRAPNGADPAKVLQVKGLYWQFYGVGKAVKSDGTYQPPQTYEALYAYDAVIMSDVEFADNYAMRKLYKDYVEDGGRLIVLGGLHQFRSNWKNTFLDDLLPFPVNNSALIQCRPPLALGAEKNTPYADKPSLFWRHDVRVAPKIEVLAYAAAVPIAARRKVGKGQTLAFAGTPCGEPTPNNHAFWDSPSWTSLLKRMVLS